MAKGTCSERDCEGETVALGWCITHLSRWRGDVSYQCQISDCKSKARKGDFCDKHGYMRPARRWPRKRLSEDQFLASVMDRIDKNTDPGGCWLWTGSRQASGYGSITRHGRALVAHRLVYQLLVGPIPDGFVIDHVHAKGCRNKHCVNPDHLEAVTHAENIRRWHEARRAA